MLDSGADASVETRPRIVRVFFVDTCADGNRMAH